jgi:hypothetical protein
VCLFSLNSVDIFSPLSFNLEVHEITEILKKLDGDGDLTLILPPKKEGSNAPMGTPVSPRSNARSGADCSERRCRLCLQRKWVECQKGQAGLHILCWYKFHTQKLDKHKEKASNGNYVNDVKMQVINLSSQQICFFAFY